MVCCFGTAGPSTRLADEEPGTLQSISTPCPSGPSWNGWRTRAPGNCFVVRDYGLVLAPDDLPPGAPLLHDFWKGAKAEERSRPIQSIKIEGKIEGLSEDGGVVLSIGSSVGVGGRRIRDLSAGQRARDRRESGTPSRYRQVTAKESVRGAGRRSRHRLPSVGLAWCLEHKQMSMAGCTTRRPAGARPRRPPCCFASESCCTAVAPPTMEERRRRSLLRGRRRYFPQE